MSEKKKAGGKSLVLKHTETTCLLQAMSERATGEADQAQGVTDGLRTQGKLHFLIYTRDLHF